MPADNCMIAVLCNIYINTLTSTNDATRAVTFAILRHQTTFINIQGSGLIFKTEIYLLLFTLLMHSYCATVKYMFGLFIALMNNKVYVYSFQRLYLMHGQVKPDLRRFTDDTGSI